MSKKKHQLIAVILVKFQRLKYVKIHLKYMAIYRTGNKSCWFGLNWA